MRQGVLKTLTDGQKEKEREQLQQEVGYPCNAKTSLHLSSLACTQLSTGPVPSEADKAALCPGTARHYASVPAVMSWV